MFRFSTGFAGFLGAASLVERAKFSSQLSRKCIDPNSAWLGSVGESAHETRGNCFASRLGGSIGLTWMLDMSSCLLLAVLSMVPNLRCPLG